LLILYPSLGAGSFEVALNDASFGLQAGSDGSFAFELRDGSLDISLGPLADVTADEVLIQYTNASTTITGGTEIEVAGITYTFSADGIAADTIAFAVFGLDANVAGFVALSGDLGFSLISGDIAATGNGVTAGLEAGAAHAKLVNANFGLIAGADGRFGFELSEGSLDIALGPLADVTADEVIVQYTNASTTITGGTEIDVAGITYTFSADGIAADTIAFAVFGLDANVAGFVALSGDLGFSLISGDIAATGNGVTAGLEAGAPTLD